MGGARSRSTRSPRAPFPKLVVSGAHHAAFDAVCDVLEERLRRERLVLPGYGHTAQRHPAFNEALADFVSAGGDPGVRLKPDRTRADLPPQAERRSGSDACSSSGGGCAGSRA